MKVPFRVFAFSVLIMPAVVAQTSSPAELRPVDLISLGQTDAYLAIVDSAPDINMKNQMLANLNTFVGRDDLNATLANLPGGKRCDASIGREQPASEWML